MIKKVYQTVLSERKRISIRLFLRRLVYPFYVGNKFYCNICGKHFRKFISKGNVRRLNAKCPYCHSLERGRVLDLYLEKELGIYQKKGIKILHFAPEYGLQKKMSRIKEVEYIDGDINPALANHVIDITSIGYENNYFDLIICSHVLGHVPEEALAIKEMYRVLKNDGVAIVMTLINPESPNTIEDKNIIKSEDRLKYYGEADLCRLHGLDFSNRLKEQGFYVEPIDYRKAFSAIDQEIHCLGDGQREMIFRCQRTNT